MRDLALIALGFVLFTIGVASVLLAAAYWRVAGLKLMSFGLLASLYGMRILTGVPALVPLFGIPDRLMLFTTAFIVYALPVVGLVYAEQVRGRGWRSSLRRLWQAGLVLVTIFIVYDAVSGRPYASLPTYRLFVIAVMIVLLPHVVLWQHRDRVETIARTIGTASLALAVIHDNLMGFRLLPWRVSVEVYGLSAFLLSLGVVTVRRFFADQRELAVVESEMSTARSIQSSILPVAAPAVANFEIAARFVPARWVGGDVYDFLPVDERRMAVLIADVTGHGVPAALIASMVKVAFSSQIAHAHEPGRVLTEMNRVLSGHFEARFVTAACVYLDADGDARYSLAGHLPPLLRKHATGATVELREGGLPLGLFADATYPTVPVSFERGDRLLLYTDGLTDARNRSGAWFGDGELQRFLAEARDDAADRFVERLIAFVTQWSGRNGGPPDDDLTAVVVDRR
jgi:sigma-B regulation protein RsbU (phosphoserine phosphatase)